MVFDMRILLLLLLLLIFKKKAKLSVTLFQRIKDSCQNVMYLHSMYFVMRSRAILAINFVL